MASLYELQGEYLDLLDLLGDPEADTDLVNAALENIKDNIEIKVEGYMKVFKTLSAEVDPIDQEIKRLQERKKTCETGAERIKQQVLAAMQLVGKDKIKTDLFTVRVHPGSYSVVIDDEEEIPEEFYVPQPAKLDKKSLKTYLGEHPECEGAHLEKNPYLIIK